MSDFYVSSVTGEPIAKEQAQSKAKELGGIAGKELAKIYDKKKEKTWGRLGN